MDELFLKFIVSVCMSLLGTFFTFIGVEAQSGVLPIF